MLSKWNKLKSFFGLLILFFNMLQFTNSALASNVIYVDPEDSIQRAINNANSGDILVIKKGVYNEYPIFVNKSLTIIGESLGETIIDGEENAILIINVLADNVKISNLTIQKTSSGPSPVQTGIQITDVKNVEISDCIIRYCMRNLRLGGSQFSRIIRNRIEHALTNGYGIHLDENSKYNEIANNNITSNSVGIQVESTALNNTIYHNNFLNNSLDVGGPTSGANNRWHNDYPSGGNYWEKSPKADLKSGAQQSEDGSDGICDQSYRLDQYPLMGPVYVFRAGRWADQDYYISIASNSSEILGCQFNEEYAYLQIVVNSSLQKSFFLRAMIPKSLLWVEEGEHWNTYLNETLLEETNIKEDLKYTYIYLTYDSGFWIIRISGTHAISEMTSLLLVLVLIFISVQIIWMRKVVLRSFKI